MRDRTHKDIERDDTRKPFNLIPREPSSCRSRTSSLFKVHRGLSREPYASLLDKPGHLSKTTQRLSSTTHAAN